MPLLSAGGVCCAVLFEDEAGLLAGAGVAAGLPADAADSLLAAGAGVDLLAGAELAAGAVAGAAAVESASVALFDLVFLVVGAAPLVSVVLVLFGAELAAALFLDLEVLVLLESAVASGLVCEASEAAAFFFAFFLVVELVSVWSVEPGEPDCCAARTVTLPKISSMATARANRTPLLDLIWLSPPPETAV